MDYLKCIALPPFSFLILGAIYNQWSSNLSRITHNFFVAYLIWIVYFCIFCSVQYWNFHDLFSLQIYTDWANYYLERAKSKKKVADLSADCRDGLLLAEVIEAVTAFKVPDLVKKPKTQQQMVSLDRSSFPYRYIFAEWTLGCNCGC